MPEVKATLTEEEMLMLYELARKRGVDPNTVLQQAISTEHILASNIGPNDKLQIKHSDSSISNVELE